MRPNLPTIPPDETPDRLDQLEGAWTPERPTKERLRSIESNVADVSYPPPSTATLVRSIRAWVRANWWALALVGATGGSMPHWAAPLAQRLGLVTKAEHDAQMAAERVEREKLGKRQAREIAAAREAAGQALDACQTAQSQAAGAVEMAESVKPKKRR